MHYIAFHFAALADLQRFCKEVRLNDVNYNGVINVSVEAEDLHRPLHYIVTLPEESRALQTNKDGFQYKTPKEVMMEGVAIDGEDEGYDYKY